MKSIDYDLVADLYDIYVDTDYDFGFFTDEIQHTGFKVLELTSGTGRLSLPLVEAGADLTCVDCCDQMLEVLSKKLAERNYSARIICEDISELDLESAYELAILPFQSFMELVGQDRQVATLRSVYQSLKSGGRFICTMHNPAIRRKTVDGVMRVINSYKKEDGRLIVSGYEQGGHPVVNRHQFFEYYDASGQLVWKRLLEMQFEMIEMQDFQAMAEKEGFTVQTLFGNYDRSAFIPDSSPVMIWILKKL